MGGAALSRALAFTGLASVAFSQDLSVPQGCRAKEQSVAEPRGKSMWAKEVIHEASGIELVFIPAGAFRMGSSLCSEEGPMRPVRVDSPFYLSKTEVTCQQYQTSGLLIRTVRCPPGTLILRSA